MSKSYCGSQALCHCQNCRKSTGSTYSTNAVFPKSAFTIVSGEPKVYETKGGSGNPAFVNFCGNCSRGRIEKAGTYNIIQLAWLSIQHYVRALNSHTKTRGVPCAPFARLNSWHTGFFVLYSFLIKPSYHSPEIRRHVDSRDGAGGTAEAALDAVNGTIDSMTKTAVSFSLHTSFLCRNGWRIMVHLTIIS